MATNLPPHDEPVINFDGMVNPRWYEFFARQSWEDYTPAVSSGAGTLTAASGTGRWAQIGRLVYVNVAVTITTNGTGATSIIADLPTQAHAAAHIIGRDDAISGKTLNGIIAAGGTSVVIQNYDASYPGANGALLRVTGCYEAESAR